jgi:hypothetical protein
MAALPKIKGGIAQVFLTKLALKNLLRHRIMDPENWTADGGDLSYT